MDDTSLNEKLSSYIPPQKVKDIIRSNPILLLVGPTGAGKDALKDKLMATGKFHHIVSHTTRPPRINHGHAEVDGKEYHFIDLKEAEMMLDKADFIEAKLYSGNLYGTSVKEIEAAHTEGKIAMTDLEVQGVAEYKAIDPSVIAVFLLPPDFKIWQDRLSHRYGDVVDAADHKLRLKTALKELDQLLNNDYFVPIINDDLQTTFDRVNVVINSNEHESPDESQARKVAEDLSEDIRDYLNKN
jgi:guanylate kinase